MSELRGWKLIQWWGNANASQLHIWLEMYAVWCKLYRVTSNWMRARVEHLDRLLYGISSQLWFKRASPRRFTRYDRSKVWPRWTDVATKLAWGEFHSWKYYYYFAVDASVVLRWRLVGPERIQTLCGCCKIYGRIGVMCRSRAEIIEKRLERAPLGVTHTATHGWQQ